MINLILDEMEEKMGKTIESFKEDLKTVRTGRANPQMLDRIRFEYYGEPTPINQMASITVSEGRQLVIKPYDKGAMKGMERAILESDLGINPQNDGTVIRLNIPPLTEQRRKEYAKQAKKYAENAKVAIRNIRRDANDSLKELEDYSEDEIKRAQLVEADLQNQINNDVSRAIAVEEDLQIQLNKEVQRARNAEADLQNQINNEVARAKEEEEKIRMAHRDDMNKINSTFNMINASINNLNASIQNLKSAFDAHFVTHTVYTTNISSHNDTEIGLDVDLINGEILSLHDEITDLNKDISKLEKENSDLKNLIDKINN